LSELNPDRQWNFIEVNVTFFDLQNKNNKSAETKMNSELLYRYQDEIYYIFTTLHIKTIKHFGVMFSSNTLYSKMEST